MVQFKAFDSKVEVNGQTVLSVVSGMGNFKDIALNVLKENGIDNRGNGISSKAGWMRLRK